MLRGYSRGCVSLIVRKWLSKCHKSFHHPRRTRAPIYPLRSFAFISVVTVCPSVAGCRRWRRALRGGEDQLAVASRRSVAVDVRRPRLARPRRIDFRTSHRHSQRQADQRQSPGRPDTESDTESDGRGHRLAACQECAWTRTPSRRRRDASHIVVCDGQRSRSSCSVPPCLNTSSVVTADPLIRWSEIETCVSGSSWDWHEGATAGGGGLRCGRVFGCVAGEREAQDVRPIRWVSPFSRMPSNISVHVLCHVVNCHNLLILMTSIVHYKLVNNRGNGKIIMYYIPIYRLI